MLRSVSLGLATVLLLGALIAIAANGTAAIPFAVLPTLMLAGLLCERYLYKPITTTPPPEGWERTDERFMDPKSGQAVTVYYNRRSGERRYVADPSGAGGSVLPVDRAGKPADF